MDNETRNSRLDLLFIMTWYEWQKQGIIYPPLAFVSYIRTNDNAYAEASLFILTQIVFHISDRLWNAQPGNILQYSTNRNVVKSLHIKAGTLDYDT